MSSMLKRATTLAPGTRAPPRRGAGAEPTRAGARVGSSRATARGAPPRPPPGAGGAAPAHDARARSRPDAPDGVRDLAEGARRRRQARQDAGREDDRADEHDLARDRAAQEGGGAPAERRVVARAGERQTRG